MEWHIVRKSAHVIYTYGKSKPKYGMHGLGPGARVGFIPVYSTRRAGALARGDNSSFKIDGVFKLPFFQNDPKHISLTFYFISSYSPWFPKHHLF
jgi:hypothetical protein